MLFKTSLDKPALAVTILISLLFAVIIITQWAVLKNGEWWLPVINSLVLLTTYLISYLFRTTGYLLTNDQLIIRRPFRNIYISRQQIQAIDLLPDEKLMGTTRTFGVGGLFGYFGKFTNHRVGAMTWYATRRGNYILLQTTDRKKIILTPDEPAKMLEVFI